MDDQIETFAANLGLRIEDLKPAEVRAALFDNETDSDEITDY